MKKRNGSNITLGLLFVIGLSLLLYPSISNYINTVHGSRAISEYSESLSSLDTEEYEEMFRAAKKYNVSLLLRANSYIQTNEQKEIYDTLLTVEEGGVMGYIEIPAISVSLPIYHGVDDTTLQRAVGHLEWTSLPTGGENTHCVLSGHRGLPSAKLFTNLDKLCEGDVFMLRILNEVLTYEVDKISVVLPENTSDLQIVPGQDYCTLVTCTPYGVNSHRLLVRGHRIENEKEAASVRVVAEAMQIDPVIISAVVSLVDMVIILLLISAHSRKKRAKEAKKAREAAENPPEKT